MAEGEDEGAAVALACSDAEVRGVGELVVELQRVVLRVSVPEELVLRERVPEAVAEAHFDVVAEVQGEGDALEEEDWLVEPDALGEELALPVLLVAAVGLDSASLVVAAEGEELTEKDCVAVAVPFTGEVEGDAVLKRRLRVCEAVAVVDTVTLRERLLQAVEEADRVTDTVTDPLRVTLGEEDWLALPLLLGEALPQ